MDRFQKYLLSSRRSKWAKSDHFIRFYDVNQSCSISSFLYCLVTEIRSISFFVYVVDVSRDFHVLQTLFSLA